MIEMRLIGPLPECTEALRRIKLVMRVERGKPRPRASRHDPGDRLVDAVIEPYPTERTQWRPPSMDWTAEEWTAQVRALRDALLPLGAELPPCLPGEEEDCGLPIWEHYATYLGALQARLAVMAETNLRTPGEDRIRLNTYEHFLTEYRKEAEGGE